MRKTATIGLIPLVLLCWLMLQPGCGGGTETGNPGMVVPEDDPLTVMKEVVNPADVVLEAVCEKICECLPLVSQDGCENRIGGKGNLSRALGLDDDTWPTFHDVARDVEEEKLEVSLDELLACLGSVRALTCDSDAFSHIYTLDLRDMDSFLPQEDCMGVFVEPEEPSTE